MIGRLLSGRYRIEAVVGTGGMAVVYRAYDIEKKQTVAVKRLRPEYESDMEFVRRFSREAEAAAKMAHENIVNLLDVGIEGDMRYIVMEYVDGQTLKDMIREEKRIHPDVALRMSIRILAAVDHAHRNGIVHRDIKPQNILVDRDGRVKVADFGIARLKTAQNTQLDPNGPAMGSVHYLSPEQAQGEVADEQSDLYSVGIVLYEMLTGRVPFDGETTVSVALKHVSEQPKPMRSLNSQVSRALDQVVMRALCKDKRRRYQSAAEMAADLRRTIEQPRGGFVRYPDERTDGDKPVRREKRGQTPDKSHRRIARVLIVVGVVVLAMMLAMGAYYFKFMRGSIPMPNLIGVDEAQAVEQMAILRLAPVVVNAYSDDYDAGVVMLQSREAGELLRENAQVTVTVSLGSQWYYLKEMKGLTLDQALSYFEEAGVENVEVDYDQSELPVGTVISMNQPEGWLSREKDISLKISGQSVSVPAMAGLTLDGAQAVIEAEGLVLGSVSQGESADAKSGAVIAQSIAPYTQVLAGTPIDLTICRERERKYAPDSMLTLVSPLNGMQVTVELLTPSGDLLQVYSGALDAGSHRISLASGEAGVHGVYVYVGEVLYESLKLDFS